MDAEGAGPLNQAGRHGLFWLALANGIGLLLATLALFPNLNANLAPLTYGRWIPLHLNFQLYGWLSFPLIALLLRAFPCEVPSRWESVSLWAWSLALGYGGLSWLGGGSSGKLFLEWSGSARLLFALALALLWLAFLARYRRGRALGTDRARKLRLLALIALLPVPFALYFSAGVGVYPPINPNSGGATGTSLLGSTLGIIALFQIAPYLVGEPRLRGTWDRNLALLLGLHFAGFALLAGHGDRSNLELRQVIALGSLLIWVPLLVGHYRRFAFPEGSRAWLIGFALWAALLTLSGWITFLPGVLEHWKFSHALVAHAHLAMAGMVTSFHMSILIALCPGLKHLTHRGLSWAWQGGLLLHLVALMWLCRQEILDPTALYDRSGLVPLLFALRWGAGCVMFTLSLRWLVQGLAQARVDFGSRASVDMEVAH